MYSLYVRQNRLCYQMGPVIGNKFRFRKIAQQMFVRLISTRSGSTKCVQNEVVDVLLKRCGLATT